MDMKDKRIYPRVEANVYVDFTGEEVLLFHTVENISLGGISLKAPSVEPIGTTVELILNFPEAQKNVACLGEVVWSREEDEGQMGVKFTEIAEDQKEILKHFLSQIDPFYRD